MISYLSDPYHASYKVQMDFYTYLFRSQGFSVEDTSYFLVCNAQSNKDGFFGRIEFSQTLIPYKTDISWIESKVDKMIKTLNSKVSPDPNPSCKNCAYFREKNINYIKN